MSLSAEQLARVLEERFGVGEEFSDAVRPLLERFAAEERSPEEWDALLQGLVEAHRVGQRVVSDGRDEVRLMIRELSSELQKIDESLKVLSVYLARIRQRVEPPPVRTVQ